MGSATDGNGHEIVYFVRIEPAFRAIQKIVAWLKSLKAYTEFRYGNIMYITLYIVVTLDTLDC